ncbi:FxsB family radical SAM/SPASM domain protein [Streptosporangiaceae bacterium NEAU-GS5]|nr:FxsB family radical SAM/SPASM domain protein [Streptosporangiaceae bacterium NEAU-GS5]
MTVLLTPFRQFVLKVHSRCDLACDHCYVYEHADQSWRVRPRGMADDVVTVTALRIAEHVKAHGLTSVCVVLHGGEPLLAGPKRLGWIAGQLRARLDPLCVLDLRIHTNGVLLDDRFLEVFARWDVKVGVSLDGDRPANDRHRRFANGRSSFDQVVQGIERLRRHPGLYAGLLCTIDVLNDPIAVYRTLAGLEPPRIDFLLPHATWDDPPPRPTPTPYADWLIAIFDQWLADDCRASIRTFESIVGDTSTTESLGLQPSDLVVIETDGAFEQADSLKTAYEGAPATGLHVLRDDLDAVGRHAGILARQRGLEGLCDICRVCPVVTTCGGGLYAHRYRTGSGFANPSVYSPDLRKLITYIRDRSTGRHRLRIDGLAHGLGDADDIRHLVDSQESIRRALVAAAGAAQEAWGLLARLDETHPKVVQEVLAHPYVRAWAAERADDHPAHMGNIAAAAAIRAGVTADVAVEVLAGAVHLPTLGMLEAPGENRRLLVREGQFVLEGAGSWHPQRRLTAGTFSIALEDTDPFRDCHGWPAAARLSSAQVKDWQDAFSSAWDLIEHEFSCYAPGLRAGLTALTPLSPAPAGRNVSATARQAFGAVAVALPSDAETLALLLMHEFQHVKMWAILDVADLYDHADTRLYYAPWRDDPRPLEGLLQGAYAYVAVTDFWRVRRRTAPDIGNVRFARSRADTAKAIDILAKSGAMTSLGKRFVAGMRATIAPWLDEPIPDAAMRTALSLSQEHARAWAVAPDRILSQEESEVPGTSPG